MSDAVIADVAMATTQGPSGEHSNHLNDSALLDAERALAGGNGRSADGRGVLGQCGGCAASLATVSTSATPTSASNVDITDDSAVSCNGEGAEEWEAKGNTTGPCATRRSAPASCSLKRRLRQ